MSTSRTSRIGYPKDEAGKYLCRWCGGSVPAGRRTFCSNDCVHHFRIRTDPGYVRDIVKRRDKCICALCGFDASDPKWRYPGPSFHQDPDQRADREARLEAWRESMKAAGFSPRWYEGRWPLAQERSLWAADHIVPVIEGGGECDLDNFRTLCIPCHRKVTGELRKRMAERKRQSKPHTVAMEITS